MAKIITQNNEIAVCGKISTELSFSHKIATETFYRFTLDIPRLSGITDRIIVTVSEHRLPSEMLKTSQLVSIKGQFRSYNNQSNELNRLLLTIFAKDIQLISKYPDSQNPNQIYLDGYVCKSPVYRKTPFGREITDILLAVNRSYDKSDYIPCIAWGKNAKICEELSIGENIKIWGRIQSRDYQKKINDQQTVTLTAYEVSIHTIGTVIKKQVK